MQTLRSSIRNFGAEFNVGAVYINETAINSGSERNTPDFASGEIYDCD
jgi:hypothetical protein